MSEALTDSENLLQLEKLVPLCDTIRKGAEYETALAQAIAEAQHAATLPNRLEEIEPVVKMLSGTPHLPQDEVRRELAALAKAGRALEKCVDAEALKDARFEVKAAQESVRRIEAMVAKAWTSEVQAQFSPLQRLGAVLAEISDTKSTGLDLQKWAGQALKQADSGLPSVQSVQQFNSAQAELAQRLDALGKLGIDDSVRDFLIEVAVKGATIASLTPEVLKWLKAKKAQSRFRIELL